MTTGVSIDRETVSYYSLTITACLSDTAAGRDRCATNISQSLTVNVLDVNDNSPQFDAPSYHATLDGSESQGTRVVRLRAVDNDASTLNSLVTYHLHSATLQPTRPTSSISSSSISISSSVVGGLFTIDTLSGWLTVTQSLTDVDGDVRVMIVAKDHGEPVRSSVTSVHITVTSRRPRITSPPDNITLYVQRVSHVPQLTVH